MARSDGAVMALEPVSDGAAEDVAVRRPYVLAVTVEGTASFLYHRWNNEAVEEKGAAAKGSRGKKSDNLESYVFRTVEGDPTSHLAISGVYLVGAVVNAAKFRQDPRSPRKSAMDLYKAAIVPLTELADVGRASWDYLSRMRAVVQRNGITRERPALRPGWRASFELQCLLPEYIAPRDLLSVLNDAGRLVGIGDYRPTYGRFVVVGSRIVDE